MQTQQGIKKNSQNVHGQEEESERCVVLLHRAIAWPLRAFGPESLRNQTLHKWNWFINKFFYRVRRRQKKRSWQSDHRLIQYKTRGHRVSRKWQEKKQKDKKKNRIKKKHKKEERTAWNRFGAKEKKTN